MARTCSVKGCDRRHLARGLCRSHYYREWYAADPDRKAHKLEQLRKARDTDEYRERERARNRRRKLRKQAGGKAGAGGGDA